ncbi:toll/interleukin-1 receptor domain-containing protein [Pseudomonas chlororaphis]|uniref:toll/interleukin-1 receptor domain-containing protein n=1 Tax=Pseudomonas chlororaphis TaxID=587753 RepID=UPI001B332F03|nr:toll/interleukin-1 receptor domain-containing protein [Pseudomonas chlororaphis]MBP5089158.1 toll/interleukin-1 receptor domain-containing protein [Pseudomonas chlororaphis]
MNMMDPTQPVRSALSEQLLAHFAFDVFISYRRSDGTQAARRLRQKLQRYDIHSRLKHLRREKLKVFLDTVYERGADDFYERNIRPALLSSRHLIVLASPDAISRPGSDDWIQREIQDFRAHRGTENILVVRTAGELFEKLPGDLDITAPNIQIIDLRRSGFFSMMSPLHTSRLADEWIKLVAPLFDVPTADMPRLRREQELAQQRVLAMVLGGSAGAIAFAVALSWYALNQQRASQQTLDNSLFAASQIIEEASALSVGPEYEGQKRSMLMKACDLFDNMAGETAREKFELESLNCDVDRITSLIELPDLERAQTYLKATQARVRARYAEKTNTKWAEAVSSLLNLQLRINLLSAQDYAAQLRVVRDNAREQGQLFKAHLTLALADDYSGRVSWLTDALEKKGNFRGSARVTEAAAGLFEAMAKKQPDTKSETDEGAQRRQHFGFERAVALQRRLGWLLTEKLGDNAGSLAATTSALTLVNEGLGLTTKGDEHYIALRVEEIMAHEVRATALFAAGRQPEGMEVDRRGLAVTDELLALDVSEAQREELRREKGFLAQRIANTESAIALKAN